MHTVNLTGDLVFIYNRKNSRKNVYIKIREKGRKG